METASKHNEVANKLKEHDPLVAELQATIENQQKLIADANRRTNNAYFQVFARGSDLSWLGEEYNRVIAMIYQRAAAELASSSGLPGLPPQS